MVVKRGNVGKPVLEGLAETLSSAFAIKKIVAKIKKKLIPLPILQRFSSEDTRREYDYKNNEKKKERKLLTLIGLGGGYKF